MPIIINKLVYRLKSLNPLKIILFGSYAWGTPNNDSDIDIIVVLDNEEIPSSYEDHNKLYLEVARCIREFNLNHPIDLLVYTKPMYEVLMSQESSFSLEVSNQGKVLYEKNN